MSGNRQKATAFILENLEAILPGNADTPRYKKYLESLTDEAFEAYMLDIKNGDKWLTLTAPNFAKTKLSLERNFQIAKKLGVSFFHHLWIKGVRR